MGGTEPGQERYEVARITIVKYLQDDDVRISTEYSEDLALIDALGMLRLSEDTVIRDFMEDD